MGATQITFTPQIPTIPGVTPAALTYTSASTYASGDLIPLAPGAAMTVVLVQNSAGTTQTVTFQGQADQWGVAVTENVLVPATSTVPVALFPPSRWATTSNTCAVTYGTPADISIAVLHVPWSG